MAGGGGEEWRSQLQVSWDWQQKQDPYELAPLLAKQMHSTPDEYVLNPPQHLHYSNQSVQQLVQWLTPRQRHWCTWRPATYPFRVRAPGAVVQGAVHQQVAAQPHCCTSGPCACPVDSRASTEPSSTVVAGLLSRYQQPIRLFQSDFSLDGRG